MLYKSVKVISDQFEHLYIRFLFGEIAKTGVADGGFPYSHITLSQNVNILVKTKNAPKALKRKINLKFFVTCAFPNWRGVSPWEFFPLNPVFCGVPNQQ